VNNICNDTKKTTGAHFIRLQGAVVGKVLFCLTSVKSKIDGVHLQLAIKLRINQCDSDQFNHYLENTFFYRLCFGRLRNDDN